MDIFDQFNSTNQVTETLDEQNANNQEEDLFGSEYSNNNTTTTAATVTNPFNNEQQEELSWVIDNDLADTTTTTTPPPQKNIFDDDDDDNNLDNFTSAPQTTLFNNTFTNQLDSLSTLDLPPTADELLYNDSVRRSSENNVSFNPFINSAPSPINTYQLDSVDLSSRENLSPLEEFNSRRQKEIAEMDAIEKQKIEELRLQGKKDLDRWYEDRRISMEQKRKSIKQEENQTVTQALEKSDKNTCDWAKVIRFLDFSQGATQIKKQKRDLNRMRAVILQAKRDRDNQKSENGV